MFRAAVAALLVLAVPVAAQPPMTPLPKGDNPEYKYWAKYKPGTTITLTTSNKFGKSNNESTAVHMLVSVAKDDLTLNKSLTFTVNGTTEKGAAKPVKILALQPVSADTNLDDYAILKPKKTVEEGEETLKVGKTEFKTKWYLAKEKGLTGDSIETKVWTSEEMPGLLVKKTMTVTGKNPSVNTTTVTAVTKK